MIKYLLPLFVSVLYRARGTDKFDEFGKVWLGCIIGIFVAQHTTTEANFFLVGAPLIVIFYLSLCTIFGSINVFNKKNKAGKIKQQVLDAGYRNIGIWQTNCIGLGITGMLQCSPLVLVSPWLLLIGLLMPLCYFIAMKFFKDTKYAEYAWGACLGFGLLLGGLI